jgi:hypothetical protein
MSQSTFPEQLPAIPPTEDRIRPNKDSLPKSADLEAFELDYKPMPLTAPVALFLGISAFTGLMGLFGLMLAAVGILVSLGSFLQIRAAKGQLSGTKLAIIGGVLSAFFLAVGTSMLIADYKAELPPGYERVNFPRQIAEKEFVVVNNQRKLHPDVEPFVDQPIFVKGWIWQSATYDSGFVLLKDNGKCCFGGNPAPNDMIYIFTANVDHLPVLQNLTGLVSVAGVLRANPQAPMGEPVYVMEAKHVAKAKTSF